MMINKSLPVIYGPVPSRRLGSSLGMVNVFPKQCSYSCVYCQLGKTKKTQINRCTFYTPSEVYEAVSKKIEKTYAVKLPIDYLTFVPTGEPAHDENLGATINLLKSLGIKIAIISNASLLTREDVINDFLLADYISLKIDTLKQDTWETINRPNPNLNLEKILKGIENFKRIYQNTLVTETMFVKGINDSIEEAELLVDFIAEISPKIAYMAFPIRPPAENWVDIPDESEVVKLYQIFNNKLEKVEYLIDYEGVNFGYDINDIKSSILEITRVHPIREDALKLMLDKAREKNYIINELVTKKQLIRAHYQGETFYVGRILSED